MSSGHWHLELEPWALAHPLLRQDVWNEVKKIPGIRQLNDMEVLSPQTYEEWMLPREQSLVNTTHRRRKKGQSDVPSTQTHKRLHPAT